MKQLIGLIGGGVMGEAILKGLLKAGKTAASFSVSDHNQKRCAYLKEEYGVRTIEDNKQLIKESEIIILAVKPQNLNEALSDCLEVCSTDKLWLSILAGITTTKLESLLPVNSKVIRVMPNTPALVGAGAVVLTSGKWAQKQDLERAKSIFAHLGVVHVLPEEMLDAATGLSGSGPAFVALFIEALTDGGVLAGLPREVAAELVLQTVVGTVKLLKETGLHPAELKDRVTSPAGTTIYGMLNWEKNGIRGTIMETVLQAAARAAEI